MHIILLLDFDCATYCLLWLEDCLSHTTGMSAFDNNFVLVPVSEITYYSLVVGQKPSCHHTQRLIDYDSRYLEDKTVKYR